MAEVCCLQRDLTKMADIADGSVVLAHLQVAFLCECDNLGLSPCGRPFSCVSCCRLRS